MIESLDQFFGWLQALPPGWIYVVLLVIAYGENVVPPIPGDVAVVIGGSLAGLGLVGVVPVWALCTLGGGLGFMTLFAFGARLGAAIEDPKRLRWIPRGPVRRAEAWLRRHGYGVVAANRFLAGGRAVIALLAGASDLRALPTAFWATASSAVWTALLVGAGYVVGSEWTRVLPYLRAYGSLITVAFGLLAVGLAVRWWWRWRWGGRRAGGEG